MAPCLVREVPEGEALPSGQHDRPAARPGVPLREPMPPRAARPRRATASSASTGRWPAATGSRNSTMNRVGAEGRSATRPGAEGGEQQVRRGLHGQARGELQGEVGAVPPLAVVVVPVEVVHLLGGRGRHRGVCGQPIEQRRRSRSAGLPGSRRRAGCAATAVARRHRRPEAGPRPLEARVPRPGSAIKQTRVRRRRRERGCRGEMHGTAGARRRRRPAGAGRSPRAGSERGARARSWRSAPTPCR